VRTATCLSLTLLSSLIFAHFFSHAIFQSKSQPPEPAPLAESEARHKIRINSDLVVLPVTVKDASGNLVAGLGPSDFRVFDDNTEQNIDVFTAEASPLSLVVLVDDDLKPRDAGKMAPSLRAIAAGLSLADEAIVCRFDLEFYPGENFSSDGDRLLAELKKAQKASEPSTAGPVIAATSPSSHTLTNGEPSPAASTDLGSRPTKALDDALYASAQLLHERNRNRRKIILLVSDGRNGAEFNQHSYEDTLSALLADNITVYGVAVGGNSFHTRFALLRKYANESGGDLYYAARSDQMEKLYSRITEQARHEYTLAYVPKNNDTSSNYHAIRVKTVRADLQVQTRQGYYSSPTADAPRK
jgi:Ca-activated chloride channel homolog